MSAKSSSHNSANTARTSKLAGVLLLSYAALAILLQYMQLRLPILSWPYALAARVLAEAASAATLGLILSLLCAAFGLYSLLRGHALWKISAVTIRQWQRFKSIRRGYWALLILSALALLVSLDGLLVGSKPLLLYYNGRLYSPAFSTKNPDVASFSNPNQAPCSNYRQLAAQFAGSNNWLIMPPVPYDAGGDSQLPFARDLQYSAGQGYLLQGEPYSGYGFGFYDNNSEQPCLRVILREGHLKGNAVVWSRQRKQIFNGEALQLEKQAQSDPQLAECLACLREHRLHTMVYHPAPPDARHWLGTNSQGSDIVAILFAGLSLNFQAALLYLPIVYLLGITVGLASGWYGGWFDLLLQRAIEVLSQVPLITIIIIISAIIPLSMKGLVLLLLLLVVFDWIGISGLMRTAALREKARDYIASARVIGASNTRIIFRHLLPNSLGLVVYMLPFSFSGMVLALASLDYLGFGLPPEYPSWGRLLNDGLGNLYKPWIVASAFSALVILLLLITFIGEAVREACDPKQHSFYR